MLFTPPIDDLVSIVGNRYALTILMASRARELQKKIPALLEGNSNIAISIAAGEIFKGEVVVNSK